MLEEEVAVFKSVIAVIAGFVVIAVLVLLTSTVALIALGPDRILDPVTNEVTLLWLAVNFGTGLLAAMVGGAVTALMAAGRPAKVLALVVLGLGLVEAIVGLFVAVGPAAVAPPVDAAAADAPPPTVDRLREAEQPPWYPFVIPFVGAAGVMAGASLVGTIRRRSP